MFRLNNKIHFSLANANSSASFKRKMFKNHRFCSFTTTNQLVNEAANDSARVSGKDRKKRPALGTNQIAGFKGFRLLASLEKNKYIYLFLSLRAGGILQILQSDWFRERAVFYDLARQLGRNRWQLHSQVCLLFVNEHIFNHFSFKTCAIISVS